MKPVLVVGNAVLDIVLGVDRYPQEDEEMRAASREARLGGNAANAARVLAGLGRQTTLLASLAPDADAEPMATSGAVSRALDPEAAPVPPTPEVAGPDLDAAPPSSEATPPAPAPRFGQD